MQGDGVIIRINWRFQGLSEFHNYSKKLEADPNLYFFIGNKCDLGYF